MRVRNSDGSRQVVIYGEILSYGPLLVLKSCSKGTYTSLAYDIGKALNSGGHLVGLRRIKIGPYDASNGQGPNEWAQYFLDEVAST